jgi:hypothetical protein
MPRAAAHTRLPQRCGARCRARQRTRGSSDAGVSGLTAETLAPERQQQRRDGAHLASLSRARPASDRWRARRPGVQGPAGTLRSPGFSSASRRNDLLASTKKRSGVFAVTVAVRGICSRRAISPKNSPPPRVATRPFLVTSTSPSTSTKNSCPISPSLHSTLPGGTSRSSLTRAGCTSSLRERSWKSGALLVPRPSCPA